MSKTPSRFAWSVWIVALGVFIGGCQTTALAIAPTLEVFDAVASPDLNSVATATPPTPLSALLVPLSNEEPLRFVLPTPAPPPVSLWRPPLYDAPLALSPFDHFLFSRPIAADEVNWPLPEYRYGDYFSGTTIVHTGIDIDASRGTPVLAAGPGKVTWAGYGLYSGSGKQDDPYGLAVVILHDFGYQGRRLYTVYAHMDRVDVAPGQKVKTGDVLGIVGSTGFTTGPHLHFEVRIEQNTYSVTRNPELWLTPPQGWGVIAGRLLKNTGQPIDCLEVSVQSTETGQQWRVRTYALTSVNSDDYYHENMVLSDLPAGNYRVRFTYKGTTYQTGIDVRPGLVSFFTFREGQGFSTSLPSLPTVTDTVPPTISP